MVSIPNFKCVYASAYPAASAYSTYSVAPSMRDVTTKYVAVAIYI